MVLLSLTKSILEKKRKRAVFHKLIITFYNESLVGAKRDRPREEKRAKKTTKKEDFLSFAFFHVLFFVLSSVFIETKCDIETKSSFS